MTGTYFHETPEPERPSEFLLRTELTAAQERGLAELRRYEDLWRIAYKVGPVMLDIRGGHGVYRTVTVGGTSYNLDDEADAEALRALA